MRPWTKLVAFKTLAQYRQTPEGILTNNIVTIVNTMIVLPCLPVSTVCFLASRASDRFACFWRRSMRSLSYQHQHRQRQNTGYWGKLKSKTYSIVRCQSLFFHCAHFAAVQRWVHSCRICPFGQGLMLIFTDYLNYMQIIANVLNFSKQVRLHLDIRRI